MWKRGVTYLQAIANRFLDAFNDVVKVPTVNAPAKIVVPKEHGRNKGKNGKMNKSASLNLNWKIVVIVLLCEYL